MRVLPLTLLAAATTSNALVLHPARTHRPVFSPTAKPAAATALHGLRGGTVRASAVSGALAGAWAIIWRLVLLWATFLAVSFVVGVLVIVKLAHDALQWLRNGR